MQRDLLSRSRTRCSASAICAEFIAFFTAFLVRVSWSTERGNSTPSTPFHAAVSETLQPTTP